MGVASYLHIRKRIHTEVIKTFQAEACKENFNKFFKGNKVCLIYLNPCSRRNLNAFHLCISITLSHKIYRLNNMTSHIEFKFAYMSYTK